MRRLAMACAVVLAGCATAVVPAELLRGFAPERKAVIVAMAVPPADAYRRVVAAFAAEGLSVGAGDAAGGWLASTPQTEIQFFGRANYRYRATVTATAGGAEVVLSLTNAFAMSPVISSNTEPGTEEVLAPWDHELWRRMQRIADRLRAP